MGNGEGDGQASAIDPYELARRDRFVVELGVKLLDARPGYAVTELVVEDQHLNFNGVCQGGVVFSLGDAAFGYACNQYGVIAGGIEAHICFAKPTRGGETLRATATEISRSRSLANFRVEVRNGDNELKATLSGTAFLTSKPMRL